jgi:hypothetical protein
MREQLEKMTYQQLLKIARSYNLSVSVALPANIRKEDLITNILKQATDMGKLLSAMASARASEEKPVRTKKDKSSAGMGEEPTKKKRGRKPKAQAGAEPSKETKTMSKELESELSVLELYKKRYAKEPTPALERIIKRQEERVMKARAK